MQIFRMRLRYLTILVVGMMISGCLPKSCPNDLAKLGRAKAVVSEVNIYDQVDPFGARSRSKGASDDDQKQKITPVCTEFATIRRDDSRILIFVDADNTAAKDQSGEAWHTAMTRVDLAFQKALDINEVAINAGKGNALKPIDIIIAGQTYKSKGNLPVVSLSGRRADLTKGINIRGHYRNGDNCLEVDKNVAADEQGDAGRETIFDGENSDGYAENVIAVTAEAMSIMVSDVTLKNGRAENTDVLLRQKRHGGAISIAGGRDIEFKNIRVFDSQAEGSGGCIAIFGDANTNNLRFENVKMSGCRSNANGGAVYIAGDVHTITMNGVEIDGAQAKNYGGGFYIAGNAGNGGPIAINGKITNSRVQLFGGGIAIMGKASQISVSGEISGNRALDAVNSQGGGVYVDSDGFGAQAIASFFATIIKGNEAAEFGSGVSIRNTNTAPVLVASPNPLPPAKIVISGSMISENRLTAGALAEYGAGISIGHNVTDVKIENTGVVGNRGDVEGIGIAIVGKIYHVELINVDVVGNKLLTPGNRNGNGIFISPAPGAGGVAESPSRITVKDGAVSEHRQGLNGAALYAEKVVGLVVENNNFTDNESSQNGGAAYFKDCNLISHAMNKYGIGENQQPNGNIAHQNGGGFYIDGIKDDILAAQIQLDIDRNHCHSNRADVDGGCSYVTNVRYINFSDFIAQNNSANGDGGASYFDDNVETLIIDSVNIFDQNVARNGNGGAIAVGFIAAVTTKLEISDNTNFNSNRASVDEHGVATAVQKHGGAVYVRKSPYILETKSGYDGNLASNKGGALYVGAPTGGARVLNSLIIANESKNNVAITGNGGAMYFSKEVHINRGGTTALGGSFIANDARGANSNGGALAIMGAFVGAGPLIFKKAKFERNKSTESDAAIHAAIIPIDGVTFEEATISGHTRTSAGCGGAMEIATAIDELKFISSTVTGNTTTNGHGGAICVSGAGDNRLTTELSITNSIISGNQSNNGSGGFLWVEGDNPNLQVVIKNETSIGTKAVTEIGKATIASSTAAQNAGAWNYNNIGAAVGNVAAEALGMRQAIAVANKLGATPEQARAASWAAISVTVAAALKEATENQLTSPYLANNKANTGSGGILALGEVKSFTIWGFGAVISGNEASADGGAFSIGKVGDDGLSIFGGTYRGNKAKAGSGGFMRIAVGNANADANIDFAIFQHNEAMGGDGGGVMSTPQLKDLWVSGSSMTSNSSVTNGGAFSITQAANVNIENSPWAMSKLYSAVIRRVSRGNAYPEGESIAKSFDNRAASGGIYYFGNITGSLFVSDQVWMGNKATAGSGGALHVVSAGGAVKIKSPLFFGNRAEQNGGVVSLGNLNAGNSLLLTANDKFAGGDPVIYFKNPSNYLADVNDIYPVGQNLAMNNWGALNHLDPQKPRPAGRGPRLPLDRRGIFLIENNLANSGDGGAIYVNNAKDVTVENMSFSGNMARGSGGTIYMSNLRDTGKINKSIIYGGMAGKNAGGVYIRGTGVATTFSVLDSSIQQSNVDMPNTAAAGGMYADIIKNGTVQDSAFIGNRINSNGQDVAGALMVNNFVGVAADTIAFIKIGMVRLPFQNNVVTNPTASSMGTILIPNGLWNAQFSGSAEDNVFDTTGSIPAPFGSPTNLVVVGF